MLEKVDVTQTPMRDYQLKLVRKTHWKNDKNNDNNNNKAMKHEGDGDTDRNRYTLNDPQRSLEKSEIRGRAKNIQNTASQRSDMEKSPGDLRRLAVTQNPMKDHQLILVWKSI